MAGTYFFARVRACVPRSAVTMVVFAVTMVVFEDTTRRFAMRNLLGELGCSRA